MITTADLIALLEEDLPRLTPSAAEMTRRAVAQLEIQGVEVSHDSLNTRALLSALGVAPELLAAGVPDRLRRHDIFGVASDYIGAVVRPMGEAGQIFVFDGFLAFLHHFASSITLLNAFLSHEPGDPVEWRGRPISEAEAVSLALFSLLARFLRTGERPPAIDEAFNATERQNVRLGMAAAITFAVLHELAHLELGHFDAGRPRSDIGHIALLAEETLSTYQMEEFEADQAALDMIEPEFRAAIQSSLIFLFGGYAFLEAFTGVSASHPLAINRLARLADAADLTQEDRAIINDWIEDRARHFRELAGSRAAQDGLARIEELVPVSEALTILARAIARLKAIREL